MAVQAELVFEVVLLALGTGKKRGVDLLTGGTGVLGATVLSFFAGEDPSCSEEATGQAAWRSWPSAGRQSTAAAAAAAGGGMGSAGSRLLARGLDAKLPPSPSFFLFGDRAGAAGRTSWESSSKWPAGLRPRPREGSGYW